MSHRTLEPPGPLKAILFDLHSTLVDQGDAADWLERAWHRLERPASARAGLAPAQYEHIVALIDRLWEHAPDLDPNGERDLSPERHRLTYDRLAARFPDLEKPLADALYETMLETWEPYDDTLPVLRGLKQRGLRTALISNVGFDVRPLLARTGMERHLDAVLLSCDVGVVKPHRAIFERALEELHVRPSEALMVGDNASDDAGAARLGIRTLLLPRTRGPRHGLDLVLKLTE